MDLVNEDLQEKFQDWDFATNSYRVYSTLDIDLQQAAVEAVQESMTQLDQQLRKCAARRKRVSSRKWLWSRLTLTWRNSSARRRTKLLDEPAKSRFGEATARIRI